MRAVTWIKPAVVFLLAAWVVPPAAAEPLLDLYTGKAFTLGSDIRIKQPTLGNDFSFRDVSFEDRSFETPPWYGVRVGYYFEKYPWLGAAIEFFHFKMIAGREQAGDRDAERSRG